MTNSVVGTTVGYLQWCQTDTGLLLGIEPPPSRYLTRGMCFCVSTVFMHVEDMVVLMTNANSLEGDLTL